MIKIKKAMALAAALCIAVTMLSACSNNNDDNVEEVTTTTEATSDMIGTEGEIQTTRPVAEGDVYAINKFKVDPIPAGYQLALKSQEQQGMIYVNGVSKITVMAANYKEDFNTLAEYAETACATLKLTNMLYQTDTEFSTPENATVAGFDAVKYDFDLTVNDVTEEGEGENTEVIKTPVEWYKSRAYFFYSDEDAYYVIFETEKDDWDANIGGFEEFMANVVIDENAVNEEETVSDTSGSEDDILEEIIEEEVINENESISDEEEIILEDDEEEIILEDDEEIIPD